MGYRYIKLTDAEVALLEKFSKTSVKDHIRTKCDTILLSNRGYDVQSLSKLYQVRTHTIRAWMDKWVEKGLDGFSIIVGRGRKAEIELENTTLVNSIKAAVELNPQDLNTVCVELNQKHSLDLTKGKLKRFLKKS
jgi:transposase